MDIIISKVHDKYAFSAGELLDGRFCCYFSSLDDFFLIPELRDTYDFAGDAHWAAQKVAKQYPAFVMAKKAQVEMRDVGFSAEDTILQHFNIQLDILNDRFINASQEAEDKEEYVKILEAVAREVDMVLSSIKQLLGELDETKPLVKLTKQFKALKKNIERKIGKKEKTKEAGVEKVSLSAEDIMMSFGEKILHALKFVDETVFVKEIEEEKDDEGNEFYIVKLSNQNGDFVDVYFSKDFLLTDIVCHQLTEFPMYSKKFFDQIFEPVVEEIGHYHDTLRNVVVVSSFGDKERYAWKGFRVEGGKPVTYLVNFKDIDDKVAWKVELADGSFQPHRLMIFSEEAGRTVLDEALGKEVKFINPSVQSLLNRTGTVKDYRAENNMVLFDVDFRRGLDVVTVNKDDVVFVY